MFYGNVGAASRFDFTVIGPVVNEVSRTTLLIIILIVLIVFGGGWYGRGRWFWIQFPPLPLSRARPGLRQLEQNSQVCAALREKEKARLDWPGSRSYWGAMK